MLVRLNCYSCSGQITVASLVVSQLKDLDQNAELIPEEDCFFIAEWRLKGNTSLLTSSE